MSTTERATGGDKVLRGGLGDAEVHVDEPGAEVVVRDEASLVEVLSGELEAVEPPQPPVVRTRGDIEIREPVRGRARTHLVAIRMQVVAATRRRTWVAWQVLRQMPATALLLVLYAPRGLGRATAAWARYLRDNDSAELRAHHAGARETAEYVKASQVRSANLAARWMVNGSLAAGVLGLALAWTWPRGFGGLLAALVFVWTIKLIPGRHLGEIGVAALLAVGAFFAGPWLAVRVPVPPAWVFWTTSGAAVLALGWAGRPRAVPLVTLPMGGRVPPLTAPMVTAALCALGNARMKEPDDVRLLTDPIRCGQGYQIDLELPAGIPAAFVIGKRDAFAAAIRRELGCVFLTVGVRHPGHLVVFVSDLPMAKAPQAPWPLMKAGRVDLFQPAPMFTDRRGDWVPLTFAYASLVIGALPRMGKTFLLRQGLLVAALDPRSRIYALDGKGTGDLAALAEVAHFYSRGRKPEEIERVRDMVRELRVELVRRADILDSLTEEECPESKVTSELADKRRDLCPIVVGIDETQSYFEYGDEKNKEHRAIRAELTAGITELVKLGPALGIIVLLASQNVTATTIPRPISTNAAYRACLKVADQIANDQILGTSAYTQGIDATQLDYEDKGVLYLRADGSQTMLVRTVVGLDAVAAKSIAARARAMRAAAGTLTGDAGNVDDAIVVLDIVADVQHVLADRSLYAAQHVELVEWLRELRSDYAALDVDELSARLRNRGVVISQVKRNSRNLMGVDLRKQGRGDDAAGSYLEDES